MASYRIYLLNREDRFVGLVEAEHASDHEAMTRARGEIGVHAGAEVWQEGRRVGRLAADWIKDPAQATPGAEV